MGYVTVKIVDEKNMEIPISDLSQTGLIIIKEEAELLIQQIEQQMEVKQNE